MAPLSLRTDCEYLSVHTREYHSMVDRDEYVQPLKEYTT